MRTLLFALFGLLLAVPGFSQGLASETEAGVDGKGNWSVTPIVFYEGDSLHLIGRVTAVSSGLRADLSIGPVMRKGLYKLQPYAGADTQGQLVFGALLSSTAGNGWYYFAEARGFRGEQTTLFHRLSAAVDKDGTWQLRLEAVQAGNGLALLAPGVEIGIKVHKRATIFLAPSYDFAAKTGGFNFGFKVF